MSEEYSMQGVPPPKPHQHSTMLNISPINNPLNPSLIMDKLNKTLLHFLHSNPNYPSFPSQLPILQNALLRTFSSSKTPTHPPYSAMIQDAVVKLDEESSLTTAEIISEYISKKYEGLPWAHHTYLKHHLDKLCQAGELIYDADDATFNTPGKKRRKYFRRKLVKLKLSTKTKENQVVEDGNVAVDQVTDLSDTHVGIQENEPPKFGRGERKRRRSYVFDDDEEEEDQDLQKMIVDEEGNNTQESGKEMVVVDTLEPLNLGHSSAANNLLGDSHHNYISPLLLSPLQLDPLDSIVNIDTAIQNSDFKEADPTPSASQLMIVPYVNNSVNLASGKPRISLFNTPKPVIVCGLFSPKPQQEKDKIQESRSRKKSKPEAKTKAKRKAQSPKFKGATLLEDGSVEQLEKAMGLHPIGLKTISMEDEEPLSEVYEKCGDLKKYMQRGKAGAEFPKEPSSSKSFVEVTPIVKKKSALTKKRVNQLYMQLRSQETYCDNVEDDITRNSSSSFLEKSGTKDSDKNKRRRGRPRKQENLTMSDRSLSKEKAALEDASDPSSSLHKNKSPKQDGGVRTRRPKAIKKDTTAELESQQNEQKTLSKQNKQLEEVGRQGHRISKATTEDATSPEGGLKKKSKVTEGLLASQWNLDCQPEDELCVSGNHQRSQHQIKQLKRGVAIEKQGDKVDEALTSLSHVEQDGECGRGSEHHSSSRTQSPVEGTSRATDNQQHGKFVEASNFTPETLFAQGQVDVKDQTQARRRSTRNLEAAKPLLDSLRDKQHDLELSYQRTFARLTPALMPSDNHSVEKVSVYLETEVHAKSVEQEQSKWPLDDKTHTPISNNSDVREHLEESYDHDQALEKMEVQVKVSKELTAKSVSSIHVPLASKDQLRSRSKHQSQDGA